VVEDRGMRAQVSGYGSRSSWQTTKVKYIPHQGLGEIGGNGLLYLREKVFQEAESLGS